MPLDKFAACKARDTLVKVLYVHLFQNIVNLINQTFKSEYQFDRSASITILDIAGFGRFLFQTEVKFIKNNEEKFFSTECFKTSSNCFEQFCINYTNEKIQAFCTQHLIVDELHWYKSEGIQIPEIPFPGNDTVLGKIL